ncbi:BLUF domain-containing protein [Methylobrevis albus]|uniref:BLUF domain-containing protein n=1 Tax=Methylobrevis albus TaxID=2793297 RepID=A0A931I2M8_9HYPH|nr:BLUF domain-containing protein [Methylobrevis albus]MBH0238304.1 BLUF domain-containing protein [Methylobrevis albus]
MHLVRLVYVSRNRILDLELPFAHEIRAIQAACDRSNPAASLTGALAFSERLFAGVLEGDRIHVSSTLRRIVCDHRHADVTLLQFGAVGQRRFADWALAYAGQSEEMERLYLRYGITAGFDPSRMTVDSLVSLLAQMVRMEGAGIHHAPAFTAAAQVPQVEPEPGAAPEPAPRPRNAAVAATLVKPPEPANRPPPLPIRSGAAAFRVQAAPRAEDA